MRSIIIRWLLVAAVCCFSVAVPGVLLADGAAASPTDRGTHCALAVSATGSARARGPKLT
jgi:hypothetical protein